MSGGPRILVVTRLYPSHDAPGRGSFVADQVRTLRAAGAELVVASWDPALLRDLDAAARVGAAWARRLGSGALPPATPRTWGAGVPVARPPAVVPADAEVRHPVDLAAWEAETLVPLGAALARDRPFDLIHAHTGLPDGAAAIALADRLGLPLLTTEHDGSLDRRLADERARAAYRDLVGRGRRLVAVSARLAAQATVLSGLPEGSIEVVPNLIDLDLFRPRPATPRDPDELLWVGNRKVSKGMPELLRAVARVAAVRPAIHLRLIGRAPTEQEDVDLRRLAADLGIAGRVRFEPPVDRVGVAAAMQRAGLFVHPSPSESFGIVAVEALAVGLPVVAVSPTVLDLIGRDGACGEAAAGPDADALADAIERALGRLGAFDPAALAAVAAPFGAEAVVGRILGIYREMIGERPAGASARTVPAPGAASVPRATSVPTATVAPERAAAVAPEPADGATPDASPPPVGTAAPSAALLVVALRRTTALERIAGLPPGAAAGLTVVTTTGPGALPPSPPAWVEVDPEGGFRAELERLGGPGGRLVRRSAARRIVDALSHPRRTLARRRLVASRAAVVQATLVAAVREASERPGRASVVAIAADDAVVALDAGLADRLVPAGMRWVADRHDEASA